MLLGGICALSVLFAVLACIGKTVWLLPVFFVLFFVVLLALAVGFVFLICAPVDTEKEQTKDSPFYRAAARLYIRMAITLGGVRVHTRGLEQLPTQGRFLLVCNHQDVIDPGILLDCFPKSQLAFISKRENNKLPIINKFMHKLMCQMINRENDREALRTILKCIQLIREDQVSIGVFPEGWCSVDGKLHPMRNGVFKIAQKTNVPIVVCTINGTHRFFHRYRFLKPTDVELTLVGVIPPEALAGRTTVDIGNQVYEMMISGLGEEFRVEA